VTAVTSTVELQWSKSNRLSFQYPAPKFTLNEIAALQLLNPTYTPYDTLFVLIRNAGGIKPSSDLRAKTLRADWRPAHFGTTLSIS